MYLLTMEINTLVLSITLLIFFILISSFRHRKGSNPPGPPGLPVIGNLHQLKTPLHEYFWRLSKKYGPLLYLKLGSRPLLVANSPKTVAEILKNQDLTFCSRPPMLAFKKLTYDGHNVLFAPYSEYWRDIRKIFVLHLLNAKRVQSFRPIREAEVSRMVELLTKYDLGSEKVDLTDVIVFLTSSVMSRVVFSKRYERGSNERRQFVENIREFQTALSDFYFTDYFPWLGWLDVVTGKIAHLDMISKKWDAFYQQLIDERLYPGARKSIDGDILDILLKLREEEPLYYPIEHIKGILVDMFFGSTDTITTTTIWAMTALIKNPHVMKRAQTEIREFLSPLPANKQILEEEDIMSAELPYLNAVIREALRKYPTLPLLIPREAMTNCTIDGFEIRAKTPVYLNAWAVANDPDIWENPEEFKPERFLVGGKLTDMDYKSVQDFDLIPFGAGRRGCPGISMGLVTVQVVLANLLCLFDWELPDGLQSDDVDTDILEGFMMHKKNPLYLIPRKLSM